MDNCIYYKVGDELTESEYCWSEKAQISGETECHIGRDFSPILNQNNVIEYVTEELAELTRNVLQLYSLRGNCLTLVRTFLNILKHSTLICQIPQKIFFSVAKATPNSQMSVCLSILLSYTKTPQNQFSNITTTFNLNFATFKLFSMFLNEALFDSIQFFLKSFNVKHINI